MPDRALRTPVANLTNLYDLGPSAAAFDQLVCDGGEISDPHDTGGHIEKAIYDTGTLCSTDCCKHSRGRAAQSGGNTISKLGDLTDMRKIVADTLALVEAGKTAEAQLRVTDYEKAWDANESKLRKLDTEIWRKLDDMSDVALSTVRYPTSTTDEKKKDLSDLIRLLDNPML